MTALISIQVICSLLVLIYFIVDIRTNDLDAGFGSIFAVMFMLPLFSQFFLFVIFVRLLASGTIMDHRYGSSNRRPQRSNNPICNPVPVAQRSEQESLKLKVAGSNPAGDAKDIQHAK